jgi:PadR family transcriptional regulator, regulatory protein PadR
MHVDHHHHPDGYRGWVRPGGRRGRWVDPFLLLLLADGETHGYALITALNELCVAPEAVDVGMAYRALREFEREGLVESTWVADDGPARRAYRLTPAGRRSLAEWTAVMRERGRLIEAFLEHVERAGAREGD